MLINAIISLVTCVNSTVSYSERIPESVSVLPSFRQLHFLHRYTGAYPDFPTVDILNLIHLEAAVMWPLPTSLLQQHVISLQLTVDAYDEPATAANIVLVRVPMLSGKS